MSHVTSIQAEIKDIDAVKALCKEMGWTFKENQRTYKWWGMSVGDYPLPQGQKESDLGRCDHAIGIPGTTWEIGLRRNAQTGNYSLCYDFFGSQGQPLQAAIGEKGQKFMQLYGVHKATLEARKRGYIVTRQSGQNGAIKLVVTGLR